MADIDLIPSDYRRHIGLRRWMLRGVWGVLTFGVVVASSVGMLSHLSRNIEDRIARLQEQKAVTTQQRGQLEALQVQRTKLEQQLQLLNGLRSGTAAKNMFMTVDHALEVADIWFTHWEFRRAGIATDTPVKDEDSGYFILATDTRHKATRQAWRIQTHMNIKGQALDYAALSRFVSRLIEQPAVRDVRVLKTGLRRYSDRDVVDFEIAVKVNGESRRS